MKKNIILVCVSAMLISMLTSCLKNTPVPNFNTVTVTFANSGPKFVTSDLTVNGKDSIQFNYTITCPTDMKYVTLEKNGTIVAKDTMKTAATARQFSAIKKLIADSAVGPFTYKVVARDAAGFFLGSSNGFTITTTSDFNYYINRTIFVPDTISKTNPCYISLATGQVFSYSNVSANVSTSSLIDIGYFYNTDTIFVKKIKTPVGHSIYALNITPPLPSQISFYDITTWTKNATVFKIASTPTFASLLSGLGIRAGCITNLRTGAVNALPLYTKNLTVAQTGNDSFAPIVSGNLIWVKTIGGKYAAVQIDYINQNLAAHGTFMTVDVKIQK